MSVLFNYWIIGGGCYFIDMNKSPETDWPISSPKVGQGWTDPPEMHTELLYSSKRKYVTKSQRNFCIRDETSTAGLMCPEQS